MVLFANWKQKIFLAGDLDLIEKSELGTTKKDIAGSDGMFIGQSIKFLKMTRNYLHIPMDVLHGF